MNDYNNATANNLAKYFEIPTEYNLSPWAYSYQTEKDFFVETDKEDVGDNKYDSKFNLENIML